MEEQWEGTGAGCGEVVVEEQDRRAGMWTGIWSYPAESEMEFTSATRVPICTRGDVEGYGSEASLMINGGIIIIYFPLID